MVETAEDPFSSAELVLGGEGGGSTDTIRLVRTVSPVVPSGDTFVIRRGNDTDLLTFERGSKDGAIIVNADGVTIKDLTVTGSLKTPGKRRLVEEEGAGAGDSCSCKEQEDRVKEQEDRMSELQRRVDELERRLLRHFGDLPLAHSTQPAQ